MRYYIDGYNLLFRVQPPHENLQLLREAFIYDLSYKAAFLKLDIVLVFDSHYQEGESTRSHVDTLEIIYTAKGESADDFILKCIKKREPAKQLTVITSDNKLAWRARRLLAKTESVEEFIKTIEKRYKQKQSQAHHTKAEDADHAKADKKNAAPGKHPAAEKCFDYYAAIFEENFQALGKEPLMLPTHIPKGNMALDKENGVEEETYKSNEERWLKIFEERSKRLQDGEHAF